MRVVYIAHPLGGGNDREANRAAAARWVALAVGLGFAPVADWIILSGELEETAENRALGLAVDRTLIERCDELWLVGPRVSPGMKIEMAHADLHRVPVFHYVGQSFAEVREAVRDRDAAREAMKIDAADRA